MQWLSFSELVGYEPLFVITSRKKSLSLDLACFIRNVLTCHKDSPSATEHCCELLDLEGHRMFVYRMKPPEISVFQMPSIQFI